MTTPAGHSPGQGAERPWRAVVALSGGVGGARLVDGLAQVLAPESLTVVVNTGDDFEHWGLSISPDLDTVMYTLAGLGDAARGWGLADESFRALEMVRRYRGEDWFQLGDRDLGTHLVRTEALRRGARLTEVTARLCRALGVGPRLLPMSDDPCRTLIDTALEGTLSFQEWLVHRRARPAVRRVWQDGSPPPAPEVLRALAEAELVLIGPSNPYVSIDPILGLPGVREALAGRPVIAVSPLVHGQAVKGPLGEMIPQLTGQAATAGAIARHYGKLLGALVVAPGDAAEVTDVRVYEADILMRDRADRARLAAEVLALARRLL